MVTQAQELMRLFTYANSPFGMKVYWALQYKRAEFEIQNANPFIRKEIAFTKQDLVPVLQIGKVWRQDSRENCVWFDEFYPQRPFAGNTGSAARGHRRSRSVGDRQHDCTAFPVVH